MVFHDARQAGDRVFRDPPATTHPFRKRDVVLGEVPVFVQGVDRPALTDRGLTMTASAIGATVALVAEDQARPGCPALIEARSCARVARLLDDGADDVVLRSDPDSVVVARLAALARRSRPEILRVGDLAFDTVERSVSRDGHLLPLLPREYALLLYLARHAGSPVDHRRIHEALWGRVFDPGTNVIAVHVSRLRAKLDDSGITILTERGRGYRLVVAAPARPVAASGGRG